MPPIAIRRPGRVFIDNGLRQATRLVCGSGSMDTRMVVTAKLLVDMADARWIDAARKRRPLEPVLVR